MDKTIICRRDYSTGRWRIRTPKSEFHGLWDESWTNELDKNWAATRKKSVRSLIIFD